MPKLYLYIEDDPQNNFGCKYFFTTEPSREESDLLDECEISDDALAFLQSLERFNKSLMDEILTAACYIVESNH